MKQLNLCDVPELMAKYQAAEVGWAEVIRILDSQGFEVTYRVLDGQRPLYAGKDRVMAPFRLFRKLQEVEVVGVVLLGTTETPSILANHKENGKNLFRIENCFGWTPLGGEGAIQLRDISNIKDTWFVDSLERFADEYHPIRIQDGAIIYGKPGKPLPGYRLPAGVKVITLEGQNPVSVEGDLLTYTAAGSKDYYIWSQELIKQGKIIPYLT